MLLPAATSPASPLRWHWMNLAFSVAVAGVMIRYYQVMLLERGIDTDVQDHLKYLVQVGQRGYAWPANPGFHWITWLLAGQHGTSQQLLRTATVVLGSAWGLTTFLTAWVSHNILLANPGNPASRSANGTMAIGAALGAGLVFPPTANLLTSFSNNYLGLLPPNVYHNSTLIVLLPFAVAAFGLGVRQLQAGRTSSLWLAVLLGVILVAGALMKPSYAFAFVPAYAWLQLRQGRFRAVRSWLSVLLAIVPVLLLIVGQSWWIGAHPEVSIKGQTHFIVAFPAGWARFMPDFSVWEALSVAVGSFALPLLAYAIRPVWLTDTKHQLAWLSTCCAFAQFMVVCEDGERARHGNFIWQVIAANHMLYWVVVLDILGWKTTTFSEKKRQRVLLAAAGLSVVSGVFYLWHILAKRSYV